MHPAVFSPDGQRVVTASHDKTARLWAVPSGNLLAVLQGHEAHVMHAAFSPDGQHVVTASQDTFAVLWEVANGRPLAILAGHSGAVKRASFSPDGQRVITASDNATVRLWEAVSVRLLAVLSGDDAVFSPNGQHVVIVSMTSVNTARLWTPFPSTQALVDYARAIVPR